MTQTASGYEPVDWQAKWNFEHELVVDQEAEIKRLDARIAALERGRDQRREGIQSILDRHVAIAIAQREQIQALEVMLSRWLDRFSFRGDSAIKLLVDDTRVHLPIPGKADMETTEGLV